MFRYKGALTRLSAISRIRVAWLVCVATGVAWLPWASGQARAGERTSSGTTGSSATTTTAVRSDRANSEGEDKSLDELLREVAERTEEIRRLNAEDRANPDRHDTGIAGGKNFTVLAPSGGFFARKVLDRAEALRKDIAIQWLGREIPEGKEFTHIGVTLSDAVDSGLTLLAGPGRSLPGNNRIRLVTTRERALGSTLAHEIVHVVLASRFPQGMPAFASEGIASLYDDEDRRTIQRRLVNDFLRSNRWPQVETLLQARSIDPNNGTGYATASSLTEFFLAHGDRARFLACVQDAHQSGWDHAINKHYRIGDIRDLQQRWQSWVARNPERLSLPSSKGT